MNKMFRNHWFIYHIFIKSLYNSLNKNIQFLKIFKHIVREYLCWKRYLHKKDEKRDIFYRIKWGTSRVFNIYMIFIILLNCQIVSYKENKKKNQNSVV